jgi:hypothetical protein
MSWRAVTIVLLAGFCLGALPAAGQEYLWCFNQDEVVFHLDPVTSRLTIEHRSAIYNCCPEPVSYELAWGEGLLTVTEIIGADPPCDCICCFNLGVVISGIPAGLWTVQFVWLNEEDFQWYTEAIQLVVPGVADAGMALQVDHEISDCLDASAVPDPPVPHFSWDAVKALYR